MPRTPRLHLSALAIVVGLLLGSPAVAAAVTPEYFDLPSGVGVQLAADQMVKIEAHYINATDQDIQGVGTVAFQDTSLAHGTTFLKPADQVVNPLSGPLGSTSGRRSPLAPARPASALAASSITCVVC